VWELPIFSTGSQNRKIQLVNRQHTFFGNEMNFNRTSKTGIANGAIVIALTLLVSGQAVQAQDATAGSYSASSVLGPDQDSLLPPEVVPLDPATASSLTQAQAEKRSTAPSNFGSFATEGNLSVPGLVDNGVPNNMQTAKDARAAAFNALYGQGSLPQQPPGGVNPNFAGGQPGMGQPPMNGSGSAQYGSVAQSMPTQSQTLSGASKIKPKVRDIKRAGISNTISALAGFTGGAVAAAALMRPTNSAMGLGMFGLTMTGFGVRNAFRF
jgi:hypothetical protein